jgi:hypothetical protein
VECVPTIPAAADQPVATIELRKHLLFRDAGKDAFHSVPLFPRRDFSTTKRRNDERRSAPAFLVLSCDPSSHLQEVRDAVECVPTRLMPLIRVNRWRLPLPMPMQRITDGANSEKRPVLASAGKDAFHSVPLFPDTLRHAVEWQWNASLPAIGEVVSLSLVRRLDGSSRRAPHRSISFRTQPALISR